MTIYHLLYYRVKIATHIRDPDNIVAVKIVMRRPGQEGQRLKATLEKEAAIHKAVTHPNIIQLFHKAEDERFIYIFLEYAAGGELFDKIAPDIGVEEDLAHFYFTQLVAGMVGLVFYSWVYATILLII